MNLIEIEIEHDTNQFNEVSDCFPISIDTYFCQEFSVSSDTDSYDPEFLNVNKLLTFFITFSV